MKEAMLRVWMQESVSPDPEAAERPGRWVAVPSWPSPQIKSQSYALNSAGLGATGEKEDVMKISSPQTVGLGGPVWSYAEHQAQDQRQDDAGSLCFDSDELSEGLEILGAPVVSLAFSSNRPVAILAVRLCDLAPDGSSLFVSHGILNLTRRESPRDPPPWNPESATRFASSSTRLPIPLRPDIAFDSHSQPATGTACGRLPNLQL